MERDGPATLEPEPVKRLLERACFVSSIPLALALAALGLREATREPRHPPPSPGRVTPFVPPPLFLAAANGPHVEAGLAVDGELSSARLIVGEGNAKHVVQGFRATGSLRVLADDSLADVELHLEPRSGRTSRGWPAGLSIHLRGVSARSRPTAVPGVRVCDLRCAATLGGDSREVILLLTWMRLPGDVVEMQATGLLARAPLDLPEPGWRWMLPRPADCVLGIESTLRMSR